MNSLEKVFHQHENLIVKVALATILLLGAILFSIGYNYKLPIAEVDEGYLLGVTFEQRGLADVDDVSSYPPIIIGLLYGSQYIVEWYTHESAVFHTGEVIAIIRFLDIGVNLLSLVFIYLFAAELGNRFSGLIAAFAFAVMPGIFEHIRLALTESWLILFITISAYAMLRGLKQKQASWIIACTISGLLAICAKYNAFPVLGFGVGSVLWLIVKDKRQWVRILVIQIILIAATAYLLLYVYGARELLSSSRPEISQLNSAGASHLLDFSLIWSLFRGAFRSIGFTSIWYLSLLTIGTIIYLWTQESSQKVAWVILLVFAVSFTWLVAAYLTYPSTLDRYVIPPSPIWLSLAAVSITYLGYYLSKTLKHFWVQIILIALLLILWLSPVITQRYLQLDNLSRHYTLAGLSQWSESSLPTGTIALDNNNWKVFDPLWGGYTGKLRPWVDRKEWISRSLEDWLSNDVFFVQLSGNYPGDNPEFIFPRDDMLHLKSFPIPGQEDEWSGPSIHIYRIWPIEHDNLNIMFGGQIVLRGYDLSAERISVGDSLSWTAYWQITSQPQDDYQLFLHLIPMDSFDVRAQADGTPALATRPTSTWDDPDETIIGNTLNLSISEAIAPGEYRLIAGLYNLETFARLTTDEALDYVVIDTITITP